MVGARHLHHAGMELDRAPGQRSRAAAGDQRPQLPFVAWPLPGGSPMKKWFLIVLSMWTSAALAEITVGVSVSTTGPGTSLGVPVSNTFGILPKAIGGEPVRYILLDDTSDPTTGAKVVNRFATEDRVDIIIGSSTVPVAIAQGGLAGEARIPFIALCPIPIDAAKQPFLFAVPQP